MAARLESVSRRSGFRRFMFAIERLLADKYHLPDASRAARDIEGIFYGEPLDYVIGWTPFLGLEIDLSLRPFIPRPETEYWVGGAINDLKKRSGRILNILDIFAGSGAIGCAVLKHIPNSRVTFAEKERRFIEQIKLNLKRNSLPSWRYRVVCSDYFSGIRGQFDVILANPPYVGAFQHLDREVKKYEPRVAYYGGKDGLSAIRHFLKEARRFVKPDGEIWMEHGASQRAEIKKLLLLFGYKYFTFHNDQYGRSRYVVIRIPPS